MPNGGSNPTGSSCALQLDPFTLPVRFSTLPGGAAREPRQIELHRHRVVMRRSVQGMRMALSLPIAAFLGVAIRVELAGTTDAVRVMLEHRDPALSVPLYAAADGDDAIAAWHAWAAVLGLPLLVAEQDGGLREPFARLGRLRIADPVHRRRKRSAIRRRRPTILMRRKPGRSPDAQPVHRGEREIIARN